MLLMANKSIVVKPSEQGLITDTRKVFIMTKRLRQLILQMAAEMIKVHEGLVLKASPCPAGHDTIGWGHRVRPGDKKEITREEADELLIKDLNEILDELYPAVTGLSVDYTFGENQWVALLSFVYNIGVPKFKTSTIKKMIWDEATLEEIAKEFDKWIYYYTKDGRKVRSNGLINRRKAEKELFLSGVRRK